MSLAAFTIATVVFGYMMIRNFMVYNYRVKLSNKVFQLASKELDSGKYQSAVSTHRWNELTRVSYDKMMFMFWRPLNSFHDKDFLKEVGMK